RVCLLRSCVKRFEFLQNLGDGPVRLGVPDVDVAERRDVEILLGDLIARDDLGELLIFLPRVEGGRDPRDAGGRDEVLRVSLLHYVAGIDEEEGVTFCTHAFLGNFELWKFRSIE